MKPEAQRIAIAEACGKIAPGFTAESLGGFRSLIPDYLRDLNAMHEAEMRLKQEDHHAYACYASDLFEEHGSDILSLSAAQRAEAFLRTIGKWEDGA